ncbi:MAG: TadE family protein [Pseudomonadota bacterium]
MNPKRTKPTRIKRLTRATIRFAHRADGISSLEFVLLLFPMMIFVFGIIQFSFIFYHYNQMQSVAREVARQIAVSDTLNPSENEDEDEDSEEISCKDSPSGAEGLVCQMLGVPAGGSITTCYEQVEFPPDTPVFSSVVTIAAPIDQLGLVIDILGIAKGRDLTATAKMRVEPTKIGPDAVNPEKLCDGDPPDY